MVVVRSRRHAAGAGPRRAWSVAVLVLLVLATLLAGSAFAGYRYELGNRDRILAGVSIGGIDVGGMTRAQAERALAPIAASIASRPIAVHAGGRDWWKTAGSLGVSVDVDAAIDEALGVTAEYGWPARLYRHLLHKAIDRDIDLPPSYDPRAVSRFVAVASEAVRTEARDALLDFRGGHLVLQRSSPGSALAPGRSAALLSAAVRNGVGLVNLPVRTIQPKVSEASLGMTIVVRISQDRLYLYDGVRLVKTYPVATGQLGVYDTPQGHFEVINKRINPTWVNPAPTTWGKDEPPIIPPGPDNPLGTRALDLNSPGIRIHGTPDDASIGHHASHGCIRMHIPDSVDLFSRVGVGTPVVLAW